LLVAHVERTDSFLDAGGFGEPPMRKNRMSVPSFFNDFARISEPVRSAMSASSLR
jgi:hypothetical protein